MVCAKGYSLCRVQLSIRWEVREAHQLRGIIKKPGFQNMIR